jgi:hypothetical protein
MKRCPRCGEHRSLDNFYRSSKSPDGRQGYCKTCVRDDLRERAARRPRKIRKRLPAPQGLKHCLDCDEIKPLDAFPGNSASSDGRHWYCLPCHHKRGIESDTRLHGSTRDRHLKRRYGLTAADVAAMIEVQGGLCAICEGPLERPHVDHDHTTGRVRGILCFNCNAGLGKFQDNLAVMAAAVEYLRKHA